MPNSVLETQQTMTKNSPKAVSGLSFPDYSSCAPLFSSLSSQMFPVFNPHKSMLSELLETDRNSTGSPASIRLKFYETMRPPREVVLILQTNQELSIDKPNH